MRKLRVMFQGGGARVVILLAAAEALQQIERENGVEIVEVAGVSAGSIAAAAMACSANAETVRRRFVDASKHFVARQRKGLSKVKRRPSFSVGTTILMLSDLVTGRPILSRSALRRVFSRSFPEETKDHKTTLGNTLLPLTVFVSNLRDGRSEPLNRHNNQNLRVVEALLRSVSLPFVFSTFETGDETDGGICGNLPVSYFGQDDDGDSRILALHFPEEAIEFDDVIGYARALLTSSMNASVREAVSQTKKYGGIACEIPNKEIGSFDFNEALLLAQDEARYQLLVAELKPIILRRMDELFGAPPITKIGAKHYERHPIKNVHDGLRRDFPTRRVLSAQAQIDGRVRPALPSGGVQTDKLMMVSSFVPALDSRNRALKAVVQGLPFGEISLPLLNIRLCDKDRCEIKHVTELLAFPNGERIENRALLFLDEIVPEERCPIELRIGFDFEPALMQLKTRGVDDSRSHSRIDGLNTERIWLIATPGGWQLDFTDLLSPDQRDFPECWRDDMPKMASAWSRGGQLDDTVARTYFSKLFDEPLVDGACIGGWRVPEFLKDTYCGFTVRRRH